MARQSVIIDTSVINHLFVDPEIEIIWAGIKESVDVFIPETVLGELIAHRDADKRRGLMSLAMKLTVNGKFINSFAEITKIMQVAFDANPQNFDWTRIQVSFEFARKHIADSLSDVIAKRQREQSQELGAKWEEPFTRLREHLDSVIKERGYKRQPLEKVMPGFLLEKGSLWVWAKMLYWRQDGSKPDDEGIRQFVEACPPFRTMLVALVVNQFERSMRDLKVGESLRAGRNDTLMAFFLPYCNIFLTDDRKHRKLFEKTILYAQLQDCQMMTLPEFKEKFMPIINGPSSLDRSRNT